MEPNNIQNIPDLSGVVKNLADAILKLHIATGNKPKKEEKDYGTTPNT